MKKITWVLIGSGKYGGAIYLDMVRSVVSQDFEFVEKRIQAKRFKRYFKAFEWIWQLFKLKGRSDFWVRNSFISVAFTFFNKIEGKNIALIYHIDNSIFPWYVKPFFYVVEKMFYRNIKKYDAVVTISQYYQDFFIKKGCKSVYKIYNAFDMANFNICDSEVADFKKEFDLTDKPIIYIGACQKAKGVAEIYQALKDLDVHLVTSGEEMVKIPARNLNLNYKNFLRLLKASSIAIEMQQFSTGWSRISHEAMLLKTPVIGSGAGATRELLEDGKQLICNDFSQLKERVEFLLSNPKVREKMGQDGYDFAKTFTLDVFKKEWLRVFNNQSLC